MTPPPAVLIRCTQPVSNKTEETDDPCRVDIHRHETLLGWEGTHPDFKAVIDFDADHYNMFDKFDNVKVGDIQAGPLWRHAVDVSLDLTDAAGSDPGKAPILPHTVLETYLYLAKCCSW